MVNLNHKKVIEWAYEKDGGPPIPDPPLGYENRFGRNNMQRIFASVWDTSLCKLAFTAPFGGNVLGPAGGVLQSAGDKLLKLHGDLERFVWEEHLNVGGYIQIWAEVQGQVQAHEMVARLMPEGGDATALFQAVANPIEPNRPQPPL